ncbi:HAD-like domain-containing protein [Truncatella angustata]|uniref:HAD-like domain-containing protein n=1 Tax=Truncatella angustata TaxID=152316 RepID=A0A9P8REH3_9PEZI|nr:HAD-like domain-containing protein [Truncatella angustata]KAH6639978.1 HAD-like domain-containing protein [Truncatella angustata]
MSAHRDPLDKKWVWFDLDDTLHEFCRASGSATNEVLGLVGQKYSISMSDLKAKHAEALKAGTAHAFTDGRTSHAYRRERFGAVLSAFSLPPNELMDMLLERYEEKLMQSLELKRGVIELTVAHLGLSPYIDFLATTNAFGVSETDGLFAAVLARLNLNCHEVVMIGDSQHRDVIPASEEGIFCIHLNEAHQRREAEKKNKEK